MNYSLCPGVNPVLFYKSWIHKQHDKCLGTVYKNEQGKNVYFICVQIYVTVGAGSLPRRQGSALLNHASQRNQRHKNPPQGTGSDLGWAKANLKTYSSLFFLPLQRCSCIKQKSIGLAPYIICIWVLFAITTPGYKQILSSRENLLPGPEKKTKFLIFTNNAFSNQHSP